MPSFISDIILRKLSDVDCDVAFAIVVNEWLKIDKKGITGKFYIFVSPSIKLKMRGTIFDPVRKKRVALTPEEEVRQQLIQMLSGTKHFPVSLMKCEYLITLNGNIYRGDLVVHDRMGRPLLLAECKAPSVRIGKEVFDQILTYNSSLGVKHILLTNGPETYFASWSEERGKYEYKTEIPEYNELSEK